MHNTNVKNVIDNLISKCSDGNYVFRGVKKIYKGENTLSSSLFREHEKGQVWNKYFSPKQAEKEIVEKARRFFSSNTSNVEILTDLRHYGGKINFIDFTYDLYVALFFTCNGEFEEDGQLVMLKTDYLSTLKEIDYEKNEGEINLIEPIQTSTSRNRVIAQKSIFIHSPLGHIPKNQYIVETIGCDYKKDFLEYLKKFHNISSDTIYNDLIGFINNEENYVSAQVKFYEALALIKDANSETKTTSKEEKYRKAIETYSKAIKLDPSYASSYNNRGIAKGILRHFKEAIVDFDKAIELTPDYADAYNSRGFAKSQLDKHKEAIVDFDKAIKLKSDYSAYKRRGRAKAQLGQHEEAIKDYNKAIELKSNFPEDYNDRGNAKARLCQYKEATVDFDKAIELKSDYADAYKNRAITKARLGQVKEIILDLEKAIKLHPNLESKLKPIIDQLKNKNSYDT